MLSDKVRIKCMYKSYAEFAVIDFNYQVSYIIFINVHNALIKPFFALDYETLRALKVYLTIRQQCNTKALFISDRGNRMFLADIDKMVKNWTIKTGTCNDSNKTDEKITPHFFRAWITYQLQINSCKPIVIDAIRGDKASNMRMFYANQVLPFEEIRREYERKVPKFEIEF